MIIEPQMTAGSALRLIKPGRRGTAESDTSARPTHRFAPVVQVLNPVLPHIEVRIQQIATMGFRRGLDNEAICEELSRYARTFDDEATVGFQQVTSDEMPSFRGGTVVSGLIIVDLNPRSGRMRLFKSCSAAS